MIASHRDAKTVTLMGQLWGMVGAKIDDEIRLSS